MVKKVRISTLGPEGTFSHEVALKYNKNADVVFANTIRDVFESVAQENADFGIVPVENSIAGTIGQTLDFLTLFKLKIKSEIVLPISHNLVGFCDINKIKILYLHPQTYEQCELFIKNNTPKAEIILTPSNGKSAEMLANSKDKNDASIIPKNAADIYNLKVLKRDVQDRNDNVTRFFVIAKIDNERTGHDKTSIAVHPRHDMPGLLYGILGEFAKGTINLTKIESRPSKGKLGDYIFYMDLEGHKTDKHIAKSLKNIKKYASVTILGSYPRKY